MTSEYERGVLSAIAAVEALHTPAPWIGIDLSLAALRALLVKGLKNSAETTDGAE